MPVVTEEETRLVPRSLVIRRHPTGEVQHSENVQVARASQLTKARSRPAPVTNAPQKDHRPRALQMGVRTQCGVWLLPLGIGMLCALLLTIGGQFLVTWGTTLKDDAQYGWPRTTQVDHLVGHERDATIPTHFTAMNLKGQVYIFEIPGGDAEHTHLLIGPHLISPGADLAPVMLTFAGDTRHPDLIVSVKGLQMRFRNTGSSYEPMR